LSHKVEALPTEISDFRTASTAGGGTALTTSKGLISIPYGSDYLSLTGRNFSGADVVQFTLSPFLQIVYTVDLLVNNGQENFTEEFQDGDATDVTFTAWDTLANGSALYVGAEVPFRGVAVVVGTTVQTAARALTIKYPAAVGNWTDIVNSEGTKVTNDCLQQDGDETWTVPDPWVKASLVQLGATTRKESPYATPMYWTRWEVDGALTSPFHLRQIRALNRSTAYAELIEGQTAEIGLQDRRVTAVEALTDTGTANLIVNVGTRSVGGFE